MREAQVERRLRPLGNGLEEREGHMRADDRRGLEQALLVGWQPIDAGRQDRLQVPATVQAVLAARIDRLSPDEKHLLQAAAVIGTNVPFPLLQAMAEVPEALLHL
ncbi:MAG TPA: hypothetical protein VHN78_03000, partial [Chloroflexota bacterium]|nr:hypothetical protein [Chloroflexota bacterium]